jgi:hypothetical protein
VHATPLNEFGVATLRTTRVLEVGMALAVEPGNQRRNPSPYTIHYLHAISKRMQDDGCNSLYSVSLK